MSSRENTSKFGCQLQCNNKRASPQRGRSEVSGARCAERASEAGARGRTNKVSGRLITAIPFGSAARRCSWENGIFCYQMTVRFEAVCAEHHSCRGQSQMLFLRRPRTETECKKSGRKTKVFRTRECELFTVSELRRGRRSLPQQSASPLHQPGP